MTLGTLMVFERRRWSGKWNGINKWLLRIIAVLFLMVSIFLAYKGWMNEPVYAWWALLGMAYAAPGFGMGAMVREWKQDTLYWWLSLPVSREKLLLAKTLVAMGKWLRIIGVISVYLFVYICLVDLINGNWSWQMELAQVQFGLLVALLAVLLGPFLIMLGLLMGTIRDPNYKILVGLLWGLVSLVINVNFDLLDLPGGRHGAELAGNINQLVTNINLPVLLGQALIAYGLAAVIFKYVVSRFESGKI